MSDKQEESSTEEPSSSANLSSDDLFEGTIDDDDQENTNHHWQNGCGPPNVREVTMSDNNNEDSITELLVASTDDNIDFLKDKPEEMTRSRRLALRLMKNKWYNPHADEQIDDTVTTFHDGSIISTSLTPSLERA